MFRCTVLFCFVLFSASTHYLTYAMTAEQKEKVHAHFMELGAVCMGEFPITEDDINSFKDKKMATGPNAACFVSCVMKKVGVMDDKGMLQAETALEIAKKVFEDPEEVQNISDFLHSCKNVNDAAVGDGGKGCERAVLAFKCMSDNASTFGFDL